MSHCVMIKLRKQTHAHSKLVQQLHRSPENLKQLFD